MRRSKHGKTAQGPESRRSEREHSNAQNNFAGSSFVVYRFCNNGMCGRAAGPAAGQGRGRAAATVCRRDLDKRSLAARLRRLGVGARPLGPQTVGGRRVGAGPLGAQATRLGLGAGTLDAMTGW